MRWTWLAQKASKAKESTTSSLRCLRAPRLPKKKNQLYETTTTVLHPALGEELIVFTQEQAVYTDVKVETFFFEVDRR